MVSRFSLLSNLLLVSVALAIPPSQLGTRFPPGEDLQLQRSDSSASFVDTTLVNKYTENWAGAQWLQPEGTFNIIYGTFIIPTMINLQAEGGALVAIAIGGGSCGTMLQVGIRIRVKGGQALFNALWEWYPDKAHFIADNGIAAGDVVTLSIMIMTRNKGMVIIRNRTRGWATTFEVNSQREICGSEAEWLVIDYRLPNGLYIPLAKFGSVTFGGAFATGLGGVTVSPLGAALLDIVQGGAPLTATSVDPNNGLLTVRYAGM